MSTCTRFNHVKLSFLPIVLSVGLWGTLVERVHSVVGVCNHILQW